MNNDCRDEFQVYYSFLNFILCPLPGLQIEGFLFNVVLCLMKTDDVNAGAHVTHHDRHTDHLIKSGTDHPT